MLRHAVACCGMLRHAHHSITFSAATEIYKHLYHFQNEHRIFIASHAAKVHPILQQLCIASCPV